MMISLERKRLRQNRLTAGTLNSGESRASSKVDKETKISSTRLRETIFETELSFENYGPGPVL